MIALRLMTALALTLAAGCATPQPKLSSEIATQLSSRPSLVDLAGLQGGQWDRMVVAGPYTTTEQLESVLGFEFADGGLADEIARSDGSNLVILVAGQRVIHAELVARSVVDFGDRLPISVLSGDAKFRLTWSDRPTLFRTG